MVWVYGVCSSLLEQMHNLFLLKQNGLQLFKYFAECHLIYQ